MKKALITGITGQDGAYLAEFLLSKDYEVHGIKRRASLFNTDRINHLYQDPHETHRNLVLHYGDLTDSTNLIRILQQVQPDEVYNLAAQSHVQVSFESPEYTADTDALCTLRILEGIRLLGLEKKTRFYQASTSELYGKVQETIRVFQPSLLGKSNIQIHGFMNVDSLKCRNIVDQCRFLLYPSASEGGAPGAVLNLQKLGVIPIVSTWASCDEIQSLGYRLKELNRIEIERAVKWTQALSEKKTIELIRSNHLYASENYNLEKFRNSFLKALTIALNKNEY